MLKLFFTKYCKNSFVKWLTILQASCSLIFFSIGLQAQVSITATAGNMGPTAYTTLKDAFDAVNAGTHQGAITIDITGNTSETTSAILNASGAGSASYSTILIRPTGGAARTISGAILAGSPLIDFNGPDHVTVDGLNTGGNSLTISNTTVSSTAGTCTIKFQADATNNTLTRCSIQGSAIIPNTSAGGIIWFAAAAISTGNDDNTISFCDIGPAGSNLPSKCIFLSGTSNIDPGTANSGIVITDNNLFDYFLPTNSSSGIDIFIGTVGTIISNNKFYQTGTRTQTGTGFNHIPIKIGNSGGNNFQIIGNTIGFANSAGTGTYEVVFPTSTGGAAFRAIQLAVGTSTATSVQGNTIAGIAISGGASGNNTSPCLAGIYVLSGLTTIGDVTGNTIGSQTETGSVTFTSNSSSDAFVMGMCNFGVFDWTTNNNVIGGITASNSSTGAASIYGFWGQTGSVKSWSCLNNTIGGNVANSIQSTTTVTGSKVQGIRSLLPSSTISGNMIRNLSAAGGTGITSNASVIGICVTPLQNHLLAQNTIFNLHNSNATDATTVTGIQFNGSVNANLVERNFIYALTSATTSPDAEINGIRIAGGTTTYQNNMIAIGAGVQNACLLSGINEPLGIDNLFHNTVYVGGAPGTGASNSFALNSTIANNTRSYRNNIFMNARSNSGATGKNYAVQVGGTAPNPTGLTLDNNVYNVSGTGTVFGLFNNSDVVNLADWQVAVGQDTASIQDDPQCIGPSYTIPDLHIHPTNLTPIEGAGVDVGIANDFDGQVRMGLTPVDIGADAGNFTTASATTVTNTNDNGVGSLRGVISSAGTGATITFSSVLFGDTIILTTGEIVINKNLILSGLGMMNLSLSGNNSSRIFHLLQGNMLEIENMSLQNASAASNGGAMLIEGNLILEGVLLQHNFENGLPKSMTILSTSILEIIGNVNVMN